MERRKLWLGMLKIYEWSVTQRCIKQKNQDKAREIFLKNVLFTIKDGKCKFYIQDKGIKVDVVIYIPKKEYEDIQIRMFNGGITAEALRAEHFKLKSANGALTLDGVNGESCELETGNGTITIQTCSI